MVEPDDAPGVDEHVAPLLCGVGNGSLGELATEGLAGVGLQRRRADQVSQLGLPEPVGVVEPPRLVNEDWIRDTGLLSIARRGRGAFEGDHDDADTKLAELGVGLPQLQQVSSAGESVQMAMQYQEEPLAEVVVKCVDTTGIVRERKGNSRFPKPRHRIRL